MNVIRILVFAADDYAKTATWFRPGPHSVFERTAFIDQDVPTCEKMHRTDTTLKEDYTICSSTWIQFFGCFTDNILVDRTMVLDFCPHLGIKLLACLKMKLGYVGVELVWEKASATLLTSYADLLLSNFNSELIEDMSHNVPEYVHRLMGRHPVINNLDPMEDFEYPDDSSPVRSEIQIHSHRRVDDRSDSGSRRTSQD